MSHKKLAWSSLFSRPLLVLAIFCLAACQSVVTPADVSPTPVATLAPPVTAVPTFTLAPISTPAVTAAPTFTLAPISTPAEDSVGALYLDPAQSVESRVEDLLARMTLDEKIGQMAQVEKNAALQNMADISRYYLGSVLSGGGGYPARDNTVAGWVEMVDSFQAQALQTRLGIPLIYGVDAVHGHNNLYGATIFPQQIGLGATRDLQLVQRIGRATAEEMVATGVRWNFAPVVAVVQDIRWGRTYEAYGENTQLVSDMGLAYLQGLQNMPASLGQVDPSGLINPLAVLATPKHYLGDGGTSYGTPTTQSFGKRYLLDTGDTQVDEATLRQLYLPPYQQAVESGAMSIMVSFSSWNGVKMHANHYLLTNVLKEELGFQGFIVSDWGGIDHISPVYHTALVSAVNAGVDMAMIPTDYLRFITTLKQAVEAGEVPMERIDDAVRRILRVKFAMGLFEQPFADPHYKERVGSAEHRELAREAVRKSLVLLKNEAALPLAKDASLIFVAGRGADNIGMMCGGWTIEWQGKMGNIQPGATILQAIQNTVSASTQVEYEQAGEFVDLTYANGQPLVADVAIVVVGEDPYAEGVGDRSDLQLLSIDLAVLERVRPQAKTLVVILLSGRPLVITEQIDQWDALVAAWLPGTEGQGVADVLFGDYPFSGKLSFTWPRNNAQLPFDFANLPVEGQGAPLFPYGFGLEIP